MGKCFSELKTLSECTFTLLSNMEIGGHNLCLLFYLILVSQDCKDLTLNHPFTVGALVFIVLTGLGNQPSILQCLFLFYFLVSDVFVLFHVYSCLPIYIYVPSVLMVLWLPECHVRSPGT